MYVMSKENLYTSNNFVLSLHQTPTSSTIKMQVTAPFLNTRNLPQTLVFLKNNFPDVLSTECFNEDNYSFTQEVQATELGHLFEHILLEYMCNIKVAGGAKNVVFNGNTSWNWDNDPEGLFHISLDVGEKDINLLIEALGKSIHLTERLLSPTYVPQFEFLLSAF